MKFKIFISTICLMSMFLSSCNLLIPDEPQEEPNDNGEYVYIITSLEEKIEKLSAEYYTSDKEKSEEIEKLKEQIEDILKENEREEDQENESSDILPDKFSYTVNEKGALITGYSGKTETIVIPSHIDGIKVYGIGESAFAFSEATSVIISEGVEYIDWFAFFNSPFLSSVTIPASVTKIEYSAFDGVSSSFVIYCHEDSYAHSYAQSYGIAYLLI